MRLFTFLLVLLSFSINAQSSLSGNGLQTDSSKTESSAVKKIKKAEWIVPSVLIVGGSLIAMDKDADEFFISNHETWEERNEHLLNFASPLDDYLQHLPAASVFALSLCKVKGKNILGEQTALFLKSELLMTAIVFTLKNTAGEKRPDGTKRNSFPSGHTAQAFMTATFLSKEYGYRSVWISVGAYSVATLVGTMRILNNRHWLSDIFCGSRHRNTFNQPGICYTQVPVE